jgi:hypothetical protein
MVCLITIAGEYAIRKFKKTAVEAGVLNATYQLLTYTLFIRQRHITKKDTEGMPVTRKEVGMKVNVDRTKYKHMLIF